MMRAILAQAILLEPSLLAFVVEVEFSLPRFCGFVLRWPQVATWQWGFDEDLSQVLRELL